MTFDIVHNHIKGELLHGHANDLLGKNLILYLSMGMWLVMSLVICVHKELKWLKC